MQLWNRNFEPVQVEDFVGIRGILFTNLFKMWLMKLVITPKMSFGTGHHATTFLVMQAMHNLQWQDKTVFDFGTGTGILAILAEKLGAKKYWLSTTMIGVSKMLLKIFKLMSSENIEVLKADSAEIDKRFDIILANINKHIILANIPFFRQIIRKKRHYFIKRTFSGR
jgi:ribosomal protein L11 methyltransferase